MKEEEIIVIGKVDDASGARLLIQYEAQGGTKHEWIPRSAIKRQEPLSGGRTAFLLTPTETDAGAYWPAKQFTGTSSPLVSEVEDISVISALENGEEIPEMAFDDSRPAGMNTSGFAMDDVIITVEAEDGSDIQQDVWGGALLAGGRDSAVCDWDFEPVLLPAYVPMQEEQGDRMVARMASVNNAKGEPGIFLGFNPNYRSAKEPAGALLGTYSDRYCAVSYPTLARPILQKAGKNGWQASVLSFERGKKMRLDCDVSGAMHFKRGYGTDVVSKKWTTLAEADSGWLAPETMMGLQEQVHRMWRYGFSIHNSLDGKGSLRVQAVARRNACTNAGVIGGQRTIAALRHDKSTMEPINWDEFAATIDGVIMDAQRGLGHVEALKHVKVEDEAFERLITLSERHGLISFPKETEKGEVRTSHMWELLRTGWVRPNEPWVAVEEKDVGTLFHLYQALTGAITHAPSVLTEEGKTLSRRGRASFNTFNKNLHKVDAVFRGLGVDTMKDYAKELGRPILPDDWNGLEEFVLEKGISGLGEVAKVSEIL